MSKINQSKVSWIAKFGKKVKRALRNPKFYILASVASLALYFGVHKGIRAYLYSDKQIEKREIALLGENVRKADDLNSRELNLNIYKDIKRDVGFYVKNRYGASELAAKLNDVEYVYKNAKEQTDDFYEFYKHYEENMERNIDNGYEWEPYPIVGSWDLNGMGFVGLVGEAAERGSYVKVWVSYSTEDMIKAKQEEINVMSKKAVGKAL